MRAYLPDFALIKHSCIRKCSLDNFLNQFEYLTCPTFQIVIDFLTEIHPDRHPVTTQNIQFPSRMSYSIHMADNFTNTPKKANLTSSKGENYRIKVEHGVVLK